MGNLIQGRSTTDISTETGKGRVVEAGMTDDAIHVAPQTMDPRGNYPATWWVNSSQALAADTQAYTTGDVSMYNHFALEIASLTATSVTVSASLDGTNFVNVRLVDAGTGAMFGAVAINAAGMYYLEGKYKAIKATQNGAGGVTIRFAHAVK